MPLEPGATLGSYTVTAKIGEGGMGEVYRARDTKLDRDVALKVLPEAFTADPDRLARFEREAKVLASLNHPNIGSIYGLEEAEPSTSSGQTGIKALVLELIEGPTLADRIAQGPIPIDEALPIAKQIAEALEAAHEQGVIHRDLKPANVKVKDDGTVKVLDFGLAKALQPDASDPNMSMSPTISLTAAATQMGMVIGTAAYMAPEQAKGKVVDKRADVWAFGALLYEMVSGMKTFVGDDVSETLARVIDREPDWAALPDNVPPVLRTFLRRCLQKNPKKRIRDIGDVSLAMEGAFEIAIHAPPEQTLAPPLRVWQRPVVMMSIVVLAVLVTGLAIWGVAQPDGVPANVTRLVIPQSDTPTFGFEGPDRDLAISADGTQMAFQGRAQNGGAQIYVRRLDRFASVPLRGSDGGRGPFFSPDGEWIGFVGAVTNALRKVSILGGPPVTLTVLPGGIRGASWSDDQIIVGTSSGGLLRVSGGGGEPENLTTLDADGGEVGHVWPSVIPGRRAVLFVTTMSSARQAQLTNPQLAVLALDTGAVTRLGLDGVSPRYVPTGHLVYGVMDGSVRAVPFDIDSLEVTGTPVPILEDVVVKNSGAASFAASDQGTLVYASGTRQPTDRTLALVGHDGIVEPLEVPPAAYHSPRASPDGGRLVVQTAEDEGGVLWVYDLSGGTQIQQLTLDGISQRPVWSPDSQRITFASDRDGTMSLYEVRADGSGVPERLTTAEAGTEHWPGSWSRDGETLLFNVRNQSTLELWTLSASGRETQRLHDTPDAVYLGPELSPDGGWFAYGQGPGPLALDVYVEPFPPTGAKRRVSQDGGYWPLWSPGGNRLFYRPRAGLATTLRLRSVDVITNPELAFTNEQPLPIEGFVVVPNFRNYDLMPDGEHFVMVFPAEGADDGESVPPRINVVLHWDQELLERVPVP